MAQPQSDQPVPPDSPGPGPDFQGGPLSTVLNILAVAVVVVTSCVCLYLLWLAAHGGLADDSARILAILALLVVGISLGGVLAAAASILTYQAGIARLARWEAMDLERIARGLQDLCEGLRKTGPATGRTDAGADPQTERRQRQIVALLREISQNVLLGPEQREQKRTRMAAQGAARLIAAFEQQLAGRAWHSARNTLRQITERYPELPGLAEMSAKLAEQAAAAERHECAVASQQVREWIEAGDWDRACQTAQRLLGKHPESVAAQSLAQEVQQGYEEHLTGQVQRLYERIEEACRDRRWSTALSCAQELITRFPDGDQARRVRAQIQVIRENAEIQYRQEVEQQIKRLIGRQQYAAAVTAAKELIAHYPASPQAMALRPQMERLEGLARLQRSGEAMPSDAAAAG